MIRRIILKQGSSKRDQLNPQRFELLATKISQQPTLNIMHRTTIKQRYMAAFLPKGYPKSVTTGYANYAFYNFVNGISGTITGTLSMQALLQALGASASISIALSATTNWIIKDGVGLLGGVIYASMASNKFDSHPKRYKFLSTLLIQISCILELITPLVPMLFLPLGTISNEVFIILASLSNVGKNIGWLAGSASRAAFHGSFCLRDNLGDVTAKAGAQVYINISVFIVKNTTAGLIGTGSGILLSVFIGADPINLLIAFVPLSAVNIWSAYMASANKQVVTKSFNNERADLLFTHHFTHLPPHPTLEPVPSPTLISNLETFVWEYKSRFTKSTLIVDAELSSVLGVLSENDVKYFGECNEMYRVVCVRSGGTRKVYLWFMEGADSEDVIRGYYHAYYQRYLIETVDGKLEPNELRTKSDIFADKYFDGFFEGLKRVGWFTHFSFLSDRRARITMEREFD